MQAITPRRIAAMVAHCAPILALLKYGPCIGMYWNLSGTWLFSWLVAAGNTTIG